MAPGPPVPTEGFKLEVSKDTSDSAMLSRARGVFANLRSATPTYNLAWNNSGRLAKSLILEI